VAGQFHNLTVSFDRQLRGVVLVFVDDILVSKTHMRVLSTPRIALDTWINARHAENLDTGFRGYFSHLKMYSRALPEDGWANGTFLHVFGGCLLTYRSSLYRSFWPYSIDLVHVCRQLLFSCIHSWDTRISSVPIQGPEFALLVYFNCAQGCQRLADEVLPVVKVGSKKGCILLFCPLYVDMPIHLF
jgi:hypothetical protein